MDALDMAKALKDSMQPKPVTGNESTKTTTVFGTARGDSKDGLVDVDLGGDTISSRGTAYASIPTNVAVKSGDTVMVQLVGADGTGKQPVVVGVQGGGDSAEVNTSDAIKKAEEASTKADNASAKADDASSKADAVKDTADSAEKKAAEAKKESENASAKAEEALSTADDARKYADNYISFDKSTGLIIGDQEVLQNGCSTHITSDKVALFDKDQEVASFSKDTINLGNNSAYSTIMFCDDTGRIENTDSTFQVMAHNKGQYQFQSFKCGTESTKTASPQYEATFMGAFSPTLHSCIAQLTAASQYEYEKSVSKASVYCDSNYYYKRGNSVVGLQADYVGKSRPSKPFLFNFEILGLRSVIGDATDRANVSVTEDLTTFKFVEFLFKEHQTGSQTSVKVKAVKDGTTVCPELHCWIEAAQTWQMLYTQWRYSQIDKKIRPVRNETRYVNMSGGGMITGTDSLNVSIVDVLGYY